MNANLDDFGKLLLRLGVGGLLLLHGIYKVQNGIGFVTESVMRAGLPSFFAYGVYVGEVVAPILVLAGLLTRPAGLIIAIDLLGATAVPITSARSVAQMASSARSHKAQLAGRG